MAMRDDMPHFTSASFLELLERASAWFRTLMRLRGLRALVIAHHAATIIDERVITVMLTDRFRWLRN
jgi:hypothetical protein